MNARFYKFQLLLCLLSGIFWVNSASAIPAFARATKLNCGGCHTAFPSLNQYGREFKTNGYRVSPVSEGTGSSDFSEAVSQFPASLALISRPYTKDKGGNKEVRAMHEAELFAGGVLFQNLSGFVEFEAEGEDDFGSVVGTAAANYDATDSVHVQVAFGPTFFADPYDTLSDARRLTAAHYDMWNSTHGNADNGDKLRHSRQQASIFGRVANKRLFYNVGVGGLTNDNIGNKSTVGFGRVAFDITPDVMIGAFGVQGSCDVGTSADFVDCGGAVRDLDFSRAGIDAQADIGLLRLAAVYLRAKDDQLGGGSETNDNAYLQLTYNGMTGDNLIVPLSRFERSESNDGADDTTRLTVGVSYYFLNNFKGSIEYGNDLSTPAGVSKDDNFTLQFVVAF